MENNQVNPIKNNKTKQFFLNVGQSLKRHYRVLSLCGIFIGTGTLIALPFILASTIDDFKPEVKIDQISGGSEITNDAPISFDISYLMNPHRYIYLPLGDETISTSLMVEYISMEGATHEPYDLFNPQQRNQFIEDTHINVTTPTDVENKGIVGMWKFAYQEGELSSLGNYNFFANLVFNYKNKPSNPFRVIGEFNILQK